MEKQKIKDIRLIDVEPPEHIRKIRQILSESNIPDDEFVMIVAGKADADKKGFYMFSGYHIGRQVDRRQMGKAFFSDLKLLEDQTEDKNVVCHFLMADSDIIKEMRATFNRIPEMMRGEVPHGDA